MKKIIYTLLIATLTMGCNNAFEPDFNTPNTPDAPQSSTTINTFVATVSNATRVDLGDKNDEGYPLMWSDGDQINITDGTNTGVYTLVSVDANGAGTFQFESGDAVAADAEQYTAWCGEGASYSNNKFTYTIPEYQYHSESCNLAGKLPLFAQSTTSTLAFSTPAALVRMNLTYNGNIGLESITIKGHFNSAPKSGKFYNTIENGKFGTTTKSSGKNNVIYSFEKEDVTIDANGKSFYIIMPALVTNASTSNSSYFDIDIRYSDGYGDLFLQSAKITTKSGVVLPISLNLKKAARMNASNQLIYSNIKEAETITFKAKSTADLTTLGNINTAGTSTYQIFEKTGYPAYYEWTDANNKNAVIHTAADMFVGVTRKTNSNANLQWFKATGGGSGTQKYFNNLKSIDFGDDFDTSGAYNMSHMFVDCQKLETINFGEKFTTQNVQHMSYMFAYCYNLTELDLTGFVFTSISETATSNKGVDKIFNNTGKNCANKPIQIKLSAQGYQELQNLKQQYSLGDGEGTYWQLVNVEETK